MATDPAKKKPTEGETPPPKPPPKKPAKKKETKRDPNKIYFLCTRCKANNVADIQFAGRFIPCTACKERAPVPENQHEADEEAKDYIVTANFYEIPERCTKCNAKMPKGAVLCTKCGFDYRHGKQHEVLDDTVKEGEAR
ncbi:MAG: hypothetical protein ACRDD1_05850, partial [Planctomycetia bacterium]